MRGKRTGFIKQKYSNKPFKKKKRMSDTSPPSATEPRSFGLPWPDLNEGLSYSDVVSPRDSGLPLLEFYSTKYKSSAPLQGWLQRIHNGQITVDGAVVKEPSSLLRVGSQLVYHRLPWREPDTPHAIGILYEDDDIIALNKPSGLQVLPGGLFQQRTVLTQLQWWQSKQGKGPNPAPVHRLGRGTSGILLCAKTKLSKARLASYFADGTSLIGMKSIGQEFGKSRKISKLYRALVHGILGQDKVVIDQPIGVVQYPGVSKGLYVASASGKPALSRVEVLARDVQIDQTLVQVLIESGRPHQIRIHLAFIGHPLLGDPLYDVGGKPKCTSSEPVDEAFAQDGGYTRPARPVPGDCGYYLHAHQLNFQHPTTQEEIKIIAPLPSVLQTEVETGQPAANL